MKSTTYLFTAHWRTVGALTSGIRSMLWSAAATSDKHCLFFRLRRRDSRACPARHGARPAPRLVQGHRGRPWSLVLAPCGSHHASACHLRPGRRPRRACGIMRKASELFAHSCVRYYSIYSRTATRAPQRLACVHGRRGDCGLWAFLLLCAL